MTADAASSSTLPGAVVASRVGAPERSVRPAHVVLGALGLALLLALGVLLTGVLIHAARTSSAAAAPPPSAVPTPATATLSGTLTLTDDETASNDCVGEGGYSDIEPGATVILTDENGKILGATSLRPASAEGSTTCVFPFTITDVPTDAAQYAVEVTHRGKVVNSRQDLEASSWKVQLSLG